MTKSQLKKSIFKFRQKQNAKWDPTRRPKNLPCRNLKTKGATIPRLRRNKAWRLDSSQTKRDKRKSNLCNVQLQLRKQPDEVNKCPSVLRKSVSW